MPSAILDQLETFGPKNCEQLDYEQATRFTRELAQRHYENFSVVSWLLPRRLRDDFRHIYAFCRCADDLGDETGDPQKSLELLSWWRRELDFCYDARPRHPVFVALQRTIEQHDIPRKPFDDLIDAFVQDQTVTRYDSWDRLLDYCRRSADPVGRLVLYVCGYRDTQRQQLSDATCTALQLANFWQDVRRDIVERDRVYLPREVADRHRLDIDVMVLAVKAAADADSGDAACCGSLPPVGISALLPAFRSTLKDVTQRTWPLFARGRQLWPMMSPDVRVDVKLFTRGGETILSMIERMNYQTLLRRPTLSRGRRIGLMLHAVMGRFTNFSGSASRGDSDRHE